MARRTLGQLDEDRDNIHNAIVAIEALSDIMPETSEYWQITLNHKLNQIENDIASIEQDY